MPKKKKKKKKNGGGGSPRETPRSAEPSGAKGRSEQQQVDAGAADTQTAAAPEPEPASGLELGPGAPESEPQPEPEKGPIDGTMDWTAGPDGVSNPLGGAMAAWLSQLGLEHLQTIFKGEGAETVGDILVLVDSVDALVELGIVDDALALWPAVEAMQATAAEIQARAAALEPRSALDDIEDALEAGCQDLGAIGAAVRRAEAEGFAHPALDALLQKQFQVMQDQQLEGGVEEKQQPPPLPLQGEGREELVEQVEQVEAEREREREWEQEREQEQEQEGRGIELESRATRPESLDRLAAKLDKQGGAGPSDPDAPPRMVAPSVAARAFEKKHGLQLGHFARNAEVSCCGLSL